MTRRSIWFVSKYLSTPSNGAPGARGFELMRAVVAEGCNCTIFAATSNHLASTPDFRGSYMVETVDGVRICWIRTIGYTRAKSLRRVLSWIQFEVLLLILPKRRFGRPDAVIASSLSLFSILTGLVLRCRYSARLVFEVRDIWPLTIVEQGFSARNPLIRILGVVEWIGYRYADVIVGTMPNLRDHVTKVLGSPRPTECVPMGVASRTLGRPHPLPSGYREEHLASGRLTIGYAGTVGASNALDVYFLAATALKDNPRFQFVVVGDGELLEDYKIRYDHLSNLTFCPKVARGSVPLILAHCDLLFVAMRQSQIWEFGFSLNKLIDYMLAAKPVIASYDGFRSMLNEADCGTFVPAGSVEALTMEIERYAAMGAAQRDQIGQRGRRWLLENRTYEALAENYLQILFPEVTRTRPRQPSSPSAGTFPS